MADYADIWTPAELGPAVSCLFSTADKRLFSVADDGFSGLEMRSSVGPLVWKAVSTKPKVIQRNGGIAVTGGQSYDYFLAPNNLSVLPVGNVPVTMIFVGKGSTGAYNRTLSLGTSDNDGRHIGTVGPGEIGVPRTGADMGSGKQYSENGNIVIADWDAAATQNVRLWADGVFTSTRTVAAFSATATTTQLKVLTNSATGSDPIDSFQAACIVSRLLTVEERQRVEGWAAWTFNLVSQLPASHPYKTAYPKTTLTSRLWAPIDAVSAKLAIWLDSQDASTLKVTTAGRVSEWISKIGTWSVTQPNANTRLTYSATTYNNLPALTSGQDGEFLSGPAPADLPLNGEAGVMSGAAAYLARRGDYTTLFYYGTANQNRARSISATNETVSAGYYGNDVIGTTRWTGFDRLFVTAISTTGFAEQWVDGGAVQSNQKNALQTPAGSTFWVGRSINGDYWKNPIQEIMVWKGTLSSDDRQRLEGYLAWRWNLVSQLPTDHPFKSAPPMTKLTGATLPIKRRLARFFRFL